MDTSEAAATEEIQTHATRSGFSSTRNLVYGGPSPGPRRSCGGHSSGPSICGSGEPLVRGLPRHQLHHPQLRPCRDPGVHPHRSRACGQMKGKIGVGTPIVFAAIGVVPLGEVAEAANSGVPVRDQRGSGGVFFGRDRTAEKLASRRLQTGLGRRDGTPPAGVRRGGPGAGWVGARVGGLLRPYLVLGSR